MEDVRRVVGVLPVEDSVVDQIVDALSDKVFVTAVLHELLFLVLPQFGVVLDFKPLRLGIAVLLLGIQRDVVNGVVELG